MATGCHDSHWLLIDIPCHCKRDGALIAFSLTSKITFEPANFLSMLKYMGLGMLVIFIIISIIILATVLINKIFSPKKKKDENQ